MVESPADDDRDEEGVRGGGPEAGEAGEAAVVQHGPAGGGWGEVTAVLAVGVIPHLAAAVANAFHPDPPDPGRYLADALGHAVNSACIAFTVLYLIRRSGEPWRRFGLVRPRPSDFLLAGPALVLVWWLVWDLQLALVPVLDTVPPDGWSPRPRRAVEYAAMAVMHAANGFSEELVTRAYLVTRLAGLLKSHAAAVLLAAAAFASYHADQRVYGMISCVLQGAAWGAAYLYLRRVWPFAFAHALYNVLVEIG